MQVPIPYATVVQVGFRVVKRGLVDLAVGADWTPLVGDVKVSQDHGPLANTINLPVNSPAGSRWWSLTLQAAETTGGLIGVEIVSTAGAGKQIEDQALDFYTYGNVLANIPRNLGALSNIAKNQPRPKFLFLMTDNVNHLPKPGLGTGVNVTRAIDGGLFAAGTLTNVAEIGSGIYSVDFGAGDMNGNVIVLAASAAGCDTTFERIVTIP